MARSASTLYCQLMALFYQYCRLNNVAVYLEGSECPIDVVHGPCKTTLHCDGIQPLVLNQELAEQRKSKDVGFIILQIIKKKGRHSVLVL